MTLLAAPERQGEGSPSAPADELFLRAILAGDWRQATVLARSALAVGAGYLFEDVVRPAMVRVGELWREGRITVADEHVATAVAELAIGSLYPEFPWPPPGGPKALVACVEGERHEFGARMVADLLALDGWDATFLGADVPTDALAETGRRLRPAVVGVSATLPAHLPRLGLTLACLRKHLPQTKILVGGRAVEGASIDSLGAEFVAQSAVEGVSAARAWKR